MRIFKNISECRSLHKETSLGFVPTMGALHDGHVSLIESAKKYSEKVVVSVFVNPKQFGPNEDFRRYPRPEEEDLKKCEELGVDYVFLPQVEEFYPKGFSTYIEETKISKKLCGEFRPGHFRGVCTVVFKLLNAIRPDQMFLGKKDAQQIRVLEKMVLDHDLGAQIIGCETVREADGLALSSRNTFLSDLERKKAVLISKALFEAKAMFDKGERRSQALIGAAKQVLMSNTLPRIQYLEVVRWNDFEMVSNIEEKCILATAVFMGNTRLIDNVFLELNE